VFNSVYSLVRDFTCLPPALKFNLVEALRSNLSVLLPNIDSLSRASMSPSDGIPITDRIASHRNTLKIYSFFLLSIVLTQESSADSGTGAKVIFVSQDMIILLLIWLYLYIKSELVLPFGFR
jgi:condensin complex subunit 1